jgi:hypothetical protein
MMRTILALTAAALLLALAPASSFGQSAGDEQYVDPFEGAGQEQGNGSRDGGGQGGGGGQAGSGSQTAEPVAPAPAPAPVPVPEATVSAGASDQSERLPVTGGPVVLIAALGAGLLAGGYALRRVA